MRYFFFYIFVFISVNILGQQLYNKSNYEFVGIVNEQLNDVDADKINKLNKAENKAQDLMIESDVYYEKFHEINSQIENEPSGKKRESLLKKAGKYEKEAIGNRVDGMIAYCEIYVKRYQIYSNDVQKLFSKANNEISDTVKKLDKIVKKYFKKADLYIQMAYYTVGIDNALKLTSEAYRFEQLGILNIMKMYSMLLGFESTTIDKEIEYLNKATKNKSEVVNIKDSLIVKTVVVYDTVKVKKKQKQDDIVFKIQIAASVKPLSIEKLKKISNLNEVIYAELVNGWYKYLVGFFNTYEKAQKYKLIVGVDDAFVVAYKNGKRINAKEFKRYVGKANKRK